MSIGLLAVVLWLESANVLAPPAAAAIVMGGTSGYYVGLALAHRSMKTRVGLRLGFTRRQSRRLKLDSPTRFDESVQRLQAEEPGAEAQFRPGAVDR